MAKIEPLHIYSHFSSAVLALTLASSALGYAQEHKSGHSSYDGDERPSHWGDLKPKFAPCKSGHHQSPKKNGWTASRSVANLAAC
jgi:carbonic anhydrase